MGLHKLTAGDGYLYLIRQVAAADGTDLGRASLADYYTSKGETPGHWTGSGLSSLAQPAGRDPHSQLVSQLWSVPAGSEVTEDQMKALFGEGLHPNADRISKQLNGLGSGPSGAHAGARLGRPFRVMAAENEFTRRLRAAYGEYNTTLGRPLNAPLDPTVRADIRTAVGREMFAETYARPPKDDRELTGFIARLSRTQTTPVAGYDLTFTPVKSVSALWGLAPMDVAKIVEDCHHRAVADALVFLEKQACLSRMGTNGVAQVDTTGFIATAFDHRDSRAGDPNLHTHVAISNKVCAIGADGIRRWLALDGQPLHKAKVSASEFYNTALEANLIAALSVGFAEATAEPGKRPVREITGIPAELLTAWSSRRAMIEHRVGQLAKEFQTSHGREPTAVEILALSQQATLETRQAKHEPRSLAEQRHSWRTEAIEILGSVRHVDTMIAAIAGSTRRPRVAAVSAEWIAEQAAAVIDTVSTARSTWQINHVRAEVSRVLRYTDTHHQPGLAARIVTAALDEHSIALSSHTDTNMGEPDILRRRDGTSVYTRHDTTVYTSTAILAAEHRILAAAGQHGGHVVDNTSIALALLQAHAENGVALNDGQQTLLRDMATSGARVQLALAPAGTGKTTAMAPLASAWINSGGTVIGLAPTAAAAEVLAHDLRAPTDTIDKLLQLAGQAEAPIAAADDPARSWFDHIGPSTLIVIDEAGMASTTALDAVISHAMATGASVRLIGDDKQLTSVAAGGVLRDIVAEHGALTLADVVRFTDPDIGAAEGAASLALRDGDPSGIAFYLDHHRVHVGADHVAADMAYEAWSQAVKEKRDALLIAPTNDLVAELNERARLDRLQREKQSENTRTVTLSDGLTASVGDLILSRSNARWLHIPDGGWVKNGHRWEITDIDDDGNVTVKRDHSAQTSPPVRLPARYAATHTTLGYARTINGAQGTTARHECHVVGCDTLTREQLYVALTRGKHANHIYFSTSEGDPHRILAPKATHPPTATDILTTILGRDGAQVSAHSTQRAELDPTARLARAADMYTDAMTTAAQQLAGTTTMARIDTAATSLHAGLTDAEAWPVLRRNLALLSLNGHDPVAALHHAAFRPIGDAIDPAAVLDWRLDTPEDSPLNTVGPLRWLPAIPQRIRENDQWKTYLEARANLVTDLAHSIRAHARSWTPATAPAWARPLAGHRSGLLAEIAVFRAAHNVDPADTRITGPQQHANRANAFQTLIHQRLDTALIAGNPGAARWRTLAERFEPRITSDPYWPQLATHLDTAARAGADITSLLTDALDRHGPLPDELPAAALWWRLAGTLAPATLETANTRLRPPWTAELHRVLGTAAAEAITADTSWPALVAAVNASDWPPADLLSAAAEYLLDAAHYHSIRPDEYTRLLTYRVELLTHRASDIDHDIPHPAEDLGQPPLQQPTEPPADDVTLLEPPPDSADTDYDLTEDSLGQLDFDALATERPHHVDTTEPVDIVALRTRRDAARHHTRSLTQAVLSGRGPAELAAAPALAELHHRHREQRPQLHEDAHAYADWVAAARTAEAHQRRLDHLDRLIASANDLNDAALAQAYTLHRNTIALDGFDIAVALNQTRAAHEQARQALAEVAGGTDGIVTVDDIEAHRRKAVEDDIRSLKEARTEARGLDNQLLRGEQSAARAFVAAAEAASENIFAAMEIDLARLTEEVDFLQLAGSRSVACVYPPPAHEWESLDEQATMAVSTITASMQTVQVLTIHDAAQKQSVLAAITAAGHARGQHSLALPATGAAGDFAGAHPYAQRSTTAEDAHARIDDGRWSVPAGNLVIIDDADQLDPNMLRYFTKYAAQTNAKLLLVTNSGVHHAPAHTLVHALSDNLPWAQHVGSPSVDNTRTATAIATAERRSDASSATQDRAAEQLTRRDVLVAGYNALHSAGHRALNTIPADRTRNLEL